MLRIVDRLTANGNIRKILQPKGNEMIVAIEKVQFVIDGKLIQARFHENVLIEVAGVYAELTASEAIDGRFVANKILRAVEKAAPRYVR